MNSKKKFFKKSQVRTLEVSKDNIEAAIEAFLRSISAIADDEDIQLSFKDYQMPPVVALEIKSKKIGGATISKNG